MIKVACGIIKNSGKYFLCRRGPSKTFSGFWEFPGGKVENNETPEDALKRELIEELNMKVEILNCFTTVNYDYDTFKIELIAFSCNYVDSTINMIDHDRVEWLDLEQLSLKKLTPADIPIVRKLNSLNR
ncbi:MAG: (deoxy)nucleoside triphosphate pyrophosphohydrolase [Gilvibacter sp.]